MGWGVEVMVSMFCLCVAALQNCQTAILGPVRLITKLLRKNMIDLKFERGGSDLIRLNEAVALANKKSNSKSSIFAKRLC